MWSGSVHIEDYNVEKHFGSNSGILEPIFAVNYLIEKLDVYASAGDQNFKCRIKYKICLNAESVINPWKLLIFFLVQKSSDWNQLQTWPVISNKLTLY